MKKDRAKNLMLLSLSTQLDKLEAKRCETKKGLKRKHAKFYFYFSQKEAKTKRNGSRFALGNEIKKRKKK
jgi:hypothetical protein